MKIPKLKTPQFKMSNARIKSIDVPKAWLIKTVLFGALPFDTFPFVPPGSANGAVTGADLTLTSSRPRRESG